MKLINTNRFFLPGSNKRGLHIATIQRNLREYMCFALFDSPLITGTPSPPFQIYIEEVTGGHLERIEDDSLAESIHSFLTEKHILDASKPLLPDSFWLSAGYNYKEY